MKKLSYSTKYTCDHTHSHIHITFGFYIFHTAQRKIGLRQFNAEYSAISKNVVAMSFQYKMWAIYDHIYILFSLQVWKTESKINILCNAYSSKSSSRKKKKASAHNRDYKESSKTQPWAYFTINLQSGSLFSWCHWITALYTSFSKPGHTLQIRPYPNPLQCYQQMINCRLSKW